MAVVCAASLAREQRPQCFVVKNMLLLLFIHSFFFFYVFSFVVVVLSVAKTEISDYDHPDVRLQFPSKCFPHGH